LASAVTAGNQRESATPIAACATRTSAIAARTAGACSVAAVTASSTLGGNALSGEVVSVSAAGCSPTA
jgi:hypothetical protein